jgi:protein SCO1/2
VTRAPIAAAALAALALLPLSAGCGGGHGPDADAGTAPAAAAHGHGGGFEGGVVEPRRQAPPLRLRDVDGAPLDIRDLRGGPALVTFVYASCPDVCPLIMRTLRAARERAGAAGARARIVAVSVDPEGDTPATVRRFLARQRLRGVVDYLVGTRAELEAAWAAWGVATAVPRDAPDLIEHSALIYGVAASGELATAYPLGIGAGAVARDLPRLARS